MSARRIVMSVAQALVSLGLLGWLLHQVGIAPFLTAIQSLSAISISAALVLGVAATLIQAQRWRLIGRGFNMRLGLRDAVAKCWQAAFLNSVLPGGLAGDAVRVVEQRTTESGSWRGSIGSVLGERLAGTAIMFLAAAIALFPKLPWPAALIGASTIVIIGIAWPSLRRIPARARWSVLGLACAGWFVFATLFLVSARSDKAEPAERLLAQAGVFELFALTAVTLAGMSIPLSWGGWGPREGAAALVFPLFGSTADAGVTVAFSYGILALISVLPGAVIFMARVGLRLRRKLVGHREIEISAEIPAEAHSSRGSGKCP